MYTGRYFKTNLTILFQISQFSKVNYNKVIFELYDFMTREISRDNHLTYTNTKINELKNLIREMKKKLDNVTEST